LGGYEAVVQAYERAIEFEELAGDPNVLDELGGLHEQERQYERAVEVYQRCLAIDPAFADVRERLGICLGRLERNAEALAVLEEGVRVLGKDEFALEFRVRFLRRLGRYEEALARVRSVPDEEGWKQWAGPQEAAILRLTEPDSSPPSRARPVDPLPNSRLVQAVVVNLTVPSTLYDVEERIDDRYLCLGTDGVLDLDWLLDFEGLQREASWTGPAWMVAGDVLFFHLTKKSRSLAKSYLRATDRAARPELAATLDRILLQADRYAGTILGYAIVSGQARRERQEGPGAHFASQVFLPISYVQIFETPLPGTAFRDLVQINAGAVNPPLDATRFAALKARLGERNRDIGPLAQLEFGDLHLAGIKGADNWYELLRNERVRFLYEEQVSEYFVEPLLAAVKDPGSPLLKECRCDPRDPTTERGRSDYFVRIGEKWLPVEVKLDVGLAENIARQLAKYAHLRGFVPTQGKQAGEYFEVEDSALCVLVDRSGIMLADGGRFVAGEPGRPAWPRESLSATTAQELRRTIVAQRARSGEVASEGRERVE
jgi:hypothetical protein